MSFWLLAPYIAVQSCYDLATREHATVSRLGIALTVSSIVVMPLLAALSAAWAPPSTAPPPGKATRTCSAPRRPPPCSSGSPRTPGPVATGPTGSSASAWPPSPSAKDVLPGAATPAAERPHPGQISQQHGKWLAVTLTNAAPPPLQRRPVPRAHRREWLVATPAPGPTPAALLRRGVNLERVTLAWNVIGIVVLAITAIAARSVALAGFGLDSVVEIGASTVVLWELADTNQRRQRTALRLIGGAFLALAGYIAAQSLIVLATGYHPRHSSTGIAWTAATAIVMFSLAAKTSTGRALNNPVLIAEGRVTTVDGLLAIAVLLGLILNAITGAWWADPLAGLVIVYYGLREARTIYTDNH